MKYLALCVLMIAAVTLLFSITACGETPATSTTEGTTTAPVTSSTADTLSTDTSCPAGTSCIADTSTVDSTPAEVAKKDPVVVEQASRINVKSAMKQQTFTGSNGQEVPYRIYVPKDYSEDYAYPVVLFLHGAGERGTDNTNQLNNVVQNLFNNKQSPFYQCILICPQCPNDVQWVNTPWDQGNYRVSRVPISKPLEAVVELLDSVNETYSTNLDRQYVMGISMGGFGTWDLLMRYPDRFAAAIPMCGGGDPTYADVLAQIPIQTFHDATDPIVPVTGTRGMVQAIQSAGGTLLTYTETNDSSIGHGVWDYAIKSDGSSLDLLNWLFAQRKNSAE